MGIENTIYDILSTTTAVTDLVGQNIKPTTPTENMQLPMVVFTVTSTTPQLHTTGDSGVTNYNFDLDIYAINLDAVQGIMAATKAALHCRPRSSSVQGCFLQQQQTQQEDAFFHGNQTFSMWAA